MKILLRQPEKEDLEWVIKSEGSAYATEYGFDATFEALVSTIVADFVANLDPLRERGWIAEVEGKRAGHVFLVKHPDEFETAKLRLLLVDPAARGLGVGDALVNACLAFARQAGYRKVTLWTQSILVGACRVYQKAGFQLVREEPHHSFGLDLIGQTWEVNL